MSALMAERRDWAEDPRQPSLFDALAPPPPRPAQEGRVVDFPKRADVAAVDAAQAEPAVAPAESSEARSSFAASSEFELAAMPEGVGVIDTMPAVEGASAIEGEIVVTPEGLTGGTRTPRAAGSPLARPTLDDVMSRGWEGLSTGLPAACPVCHGELLPAASGPRQAHCGSCGTSID